MTAKPAPQPTKRTLSEAVYRQIMEDESAPPAVRLQAAERYDALENGRIGVSHPVTVDDLDALDDEQCEKLFFALMRRFDRALPGFLDELLQQAAEQLVADQASQPRRNRFTRGEPRPRPAHVPEPHPKALKEPVREPVSAENVAPHPEARNAHQEPLQRPVPTAQIAVPISEAPPPLRGAARARVVEAFEDDKSGGEDPGVGMPGYIDPRVVERSARLAPSMAQDLALRDYLMPWRWRQ